MKTRFLNIFLIVGFLNLNASANSDSTVVIYFSGDVTLANHFEYFVGNKYDYAFKKIRWFADADISMINLENPLTRRGKAVDKRFTFRAIPEYASMLKKHGVDIVTLANNHIYDFGPTGVFDTITKLSENKIHFVGAGRNLDEARHPVIYYIKGLKIAFFAYYGTHKHSDSYPAQPDSAGTAMRRLEIIREDIEKFRSSVDYIIVNFHWGNEKATIPGKDQIYFAHRVVDFGADLVVGHHPHVLQGIEKYNDKIIAYSLGNFIFGANSRPEYTTALLRVDLDKNKIKPTVIPLNVKYWQPLKLEGNAGKTVVDSLKKLSQNFDQSIFE